MAHSSKDLDLFQAFSKKELKLFKYMALFLSGFSSANSFQNEGLLQMDLCSSLDMFCKKKQTYIPEPEITVGGLANNYLLCWLVLCDCGGAEK